MLKTAPRLLFAAPASGSGKTTVTCAVLRAFVKAGKRAASFKCGPDYIDPMFHRACVGTAYSGNLDLYLGDAQTARRLLAERAGEISVLEGVMGYYDGLAGKSDEASSYAVAKTTGTPTILVVNGRGLSVSAAALVKGFQSFRPDAGIAAVIFNQMSPALYPEMKTLIERECGIPAAGYLPPMPECAVESRHLGLVTAGEIADLQVRLDLLAARAAETVDLAMLERIAQSAPPLAYDPLGLPQSAVRPRVAVARDEAFCFYYDDSLAMLEQMGAELIYFSPLRDGALPDQADALLLGGGYPELYAAQLAENESMRRAVKDAATGGLPTIAECGGFLYLHRTLRDAQGAAHPMAGVLDAEAFPAGKLVRFGYAELAAKEENLLCGAGEKLRAHEFHYWESSAPGVGFAAKKPLRSTAWDCGYAAERLYAGFPHLYLAGAPKAAARFLAAAERFQKEQGR